MTRFLITLVALGGCTAVPLVSAPGTQPPALYAVMQPLCLFACSNPVTTVREDVLSSGNAPLTTGATTTSQSTSQAGGN